MTPLKHKKAAIELSIGTIVIIVLAMAMLILGLVLIRGIFSGATDSVKNINAGVQTEINKLFQSENDKAVIRLTDSTAQIKQGEDFGVAFGIRNINKGATEATVFNYQVALDDSNIKNNCGVSEQQANSWVKIGTGRMSVQPGEVGYDVVLISVPVVAPLCKTKFRLTIWEQGKSPSDAYVNPPFFVQINSKGIF